MALANHGHRTGAIAVDLTVLQAPGDTKSDQSSAWIAPSLQFELFADVVFTATGSRVEQDGFGNTTWVGMVDGLKHGVVTLTTNGTRLVGRVDLGLSQYLLSGDTKSGFWVTELDPSSFAGFDDSELYKGEEPSDPFLNLGSSSNHVVTGAPPNRTIDVLVLYSSNAAIQMGAFDVSPFVANLIADNNQSYYNSNVNAAARVVGYEQIAGYVEPILSGTNTGPEFKRVRADMQSGSGYFWEVPSLIQQYHADVAVMFIDGTRVHDGYCGLSYFMGDPPGSSASFVDMVVATDCGAGDRTFTHELGHILSGRHDGTEGVSGNPFPNDFGYSSPSPQFHTIMGELPAGGPCGFSGCPRINRWSSLTQTYMGAPLGHTVTNTQGTFYSDMATVLDTTVPIVAAYRSPTGLALPGSPGAIQSRDCNNMTRFSWAAASGTVGWYDADWSSSPSFSSSWPAYNGPARSFSKHVITSLYLRVRACNAAGCGSAQIEQVPPTGPICEPV